MADKKSFDPGKIQSLERASDKLLAEGLSLTKKLRAEILKLQEIMMDIPSDAKNADVTRIAEKVTLKCAWSNNLKNESQRLKKQMKRAAEDTLAFDSKAAQTAGETLRQITVLQRQIEQYNKLFSDGKINGSTKDLVIAVENIEKNLGKVEDAMKKCQRHASGLEDVASEYSPDPVNLATGNFSFCHTDIKIPGAVPLAFVRSYNAMETEQGIFGEGWRHNFEVQLRENADGQMEVILEDGHAEYFRETETDLYRSVFRSGLKMKKTSNGYWFRTAEFETYEFSKEGMLQKKSDRNGMELCFAYEEGNLKEVSSISGTLFFHYGENQELTEICDHTGRKVVFTYENGRLINASGPEEKAYTYAYHSDGMLSAVTNALGIQTVHNVYDQIGRPLKQTFADGGVMEYEYRDDAQEISMTQQNGSQVTYVHDQQYCNTKIIWEDAVEERTFDKKRRRTSVTDANGNTTEYGYDARGNVKLIHDPLGNEIEVAYDLRNQPETIKINGILKQKNEYDRKGNLLSSEDALGRRTKIGYNRFGKPEQVTLADGSQMVFSYDGRGNIQSIQNPYGAVTHYQYDALNRVTMTEDPRGNQYIYTYNQRNDLETVTDSAGNQRKYFYNANGKVVGIKDFDGAEAKISYHCTGKPEAITDAEGGVTHYHYDLMWNVKEIINPAGDSQRFGYDQRNRLISVTDANGGITSFQYDPKGNVTQITHPEGNGVSFVYDAADQRVGIIQADGSKMHCTYNESGQITEICDANQGRYRFIYDDAGELIEKIDSAGSIVQYTYTPLGQVETIRQGRFLTVYRYEPGGRLSSMIDPSGTEIFYAYDANGNVVKESNSLGEATVYEYDKLDRIVKMTNAVGGSKIYTYDPVGNVTSVTDEAGSTTSYTYSPNGNLESVTDALGNRTFYTYDKASRLTKIERMQEVDESLAKMERINEASRQIQVTEYKRDRLGNLTSFTDPLGNTETYVYDKNGNIVMKVDADGYQTDYQYDVVENLSKVNYADGKTVKFTYNPLKELIQAEDWLGCTKIDVDEVGRATKVQNYDGKEVQYQWSPEGLREQTVYPDGSKVQYQYDDRGRLQRMIHGEDETTYQYDGFGRLKEKLLPNGISSTYQYNELGRITKLIHQGVDSQEQFSYEYDLLGRKTKMIRDEGHQTAEYRYRYDELSRLIQVDKNKDILQQFQYDGFGNRIWEKNGEQEISYVYNQRNQLVKKILPDIEETFQFDRRGNLTGIMENGQKKQSFQYGSINRLTETINWKKQLTAQYIYNGLGERSGQNIYQGTNPETMDSCQKIRYTLDFTKDFNNLLETEDLLGTEQYLWDYQLVSGNRGTQSTFYTQDDLGSVIGTYDSLGSKISHYEYQAFGESMTKPDGFGFTGYQTDPVSGLYFAQARYYDPAMGRFVSDDWIKGFTFQPETLNEYVYCINDPNDYVDEDGELWHIAVGAFVGGMLEGGINAYTQYKKTGKINPRKVLAAGAKGAVVGAVSAATGGAAGELAAKGAVVINAATSGVASAAEDMVDDLIDKKKINVGKSAKNGLADALNSVCGDKLFGFLKSKAGGLELLRLLKENPVVDKMGEKLGIGQKLLNSQWREIELLAKNHGIARRELKILLLQYAAKTFGSDVADQLKDKSCSEILKILKGRAKFITCPD